MRPSAELAAVFERYVAAWNARDVANVVGLISRSSDVLLIGTDGREWIAGPGSREIVGSQVKQMPPFEWIVRQIRAFEEGSVGWVVADTEVRVTGREPLSARFTLVFSLEEGSWKVVHSHSSIPVDQVESFGIELATSLEQVLESLPESTADELRSQLGTSTVTVVFTDVVDSSSMLTEIGEDRWTGLIRSHLADVATRTRARNGVLVKSLGDGTMLAFGSARDALRVAVEIQQRAVASSVALPIRIGIHTGDVVQADDDYFGQVVNKAARIASAASGGEIMVSDVVAALLEPEKAELSDPIRVELKGIPGRHTIYSVDGGEPS